MAILSETNGCIPEVFFGASLTNQPSDTGDMRQEAASFQAFNLGPTALEGSNGWPLYRILLS